MLIGSLRKLTLLSTLLPLFLLQYRLFYMSQEYIGVLDIPDT